MRIITLAHAVITFNPRFPNDLSILTEAIVSKMSFFSDAAPAKKGKKKKKAGPLSRPIICICNDQ